MARQHGASKKGFHFLEAFKNCKRKFFIQHVLGIEPVRVPHMLVFGSAFHEGKAKFYETGSLKKAEKALLAEIAANEGSCEEPEKWIPAFRHRGPVMLRRWVSLFGANDLAVYRILALEAVQEVSLPNGYTITAKPDVVLATDEAVYLFETKTSFYSGNLQEELVSVGDQATMYLYAWNKKNPKRVAAGVVPDICAWSDRSANEAKIDCFRGRLATRSSLDFWEFEQGIMSDLVDMAGRIKALEHRPYAQLFPRSTGYCLSYNRRCEYYDICRSDLTELEKLPNGFKKTAWPEKRKLVAMSEKIPIAARPKVRRISR